MDRNLIECLIRGDLQFFKSVPSDVLLKFTSDIGDSILTCAVRENRFDCCEEIYRRCPSLLYHQNSTYDTVFHYAAWHGDIKTVRFLISALGKADFESKDEDIENQGGERLLNKNQLLKIRNRIGYTALHNAMINQQTEAAKLLIQADTSNGDLIGIVDKDNKTVLHMAVESANFEIVKLLILKDVDNELLRTANELTKNAFLLAAKHGDVKIMGLLIEADTGNELLGAVHDLEMNSALHLAVRYDNLEMLNMLIDADPCKKLLRILNVDKDTALHLAVRNNSLEAVKLLIEADPDFEYLPNDSGETPLLITLHERVPSENSEIRKLLLRKQPSQCRVGIGDMGWTPLHHATHFRNLSAIDDIILLCPDCLEIVDNKGQNFLHIAAKCEAVRVVKHILVMMEIPDYVLNWQDNEGNTPLHTAVSSGYETVALCFLYCPRVDKKTTNKKGEQVLHAINFTYDKVKAGIYGARMDEKDLKDQSDFDLVVGALIATVSFTAGITVPGGYISDGPNQGTAVLSNKMPFKAFVVSNTFALLFSLYAVFSHFCARRLDNKKHIINQLNVAALCTFGAIFAMVVAFITGSYAVLANSGGLAITVCVICCCFFIFAFRVMFRMGLKPWRAAP